jgi:hypothetical protein
MMPNRGPRTINAAMDFEYSNEHEHNEKARGFVYL